MPGFPRVLISVAEAYSARRDEIENSAEGMLGELKRLDRIVAPKGEAEGGLSFEVVDHAVNQLMRALDPVHGGIGNKAKLPPSKAPDFLPRPERRAKDTGPLSEGDLASD